MRQVRNGVFETNSSSVHSITMCTKSDYDKWVNGEIYWSRWDDKFVSKEVFEKELEDQKKFFSEECPEYERGTEEWEDEFNDYLRNEADFEYYTYDDYCEYLEYEKYVETFTTPSGEEVVSFGYYGNDY